MTYEGSEREPHTPLLEDTERCRICGQTRNYYLHQEAQ